ncbi:MULTISPECIES: DciA family protein [Nitrosomonas]|uniref:Uncharacterized protein DUF721 n=1 Tax=Nitrosomonas communis TaxID=44574 RepID=A0A0F7KF60_9PROT|nr:MULTISPECIES: DciA family protein [Nitrosomonas]AKH37457.1 hypothetical protein AAW31_05915 [Nitrosomonas communis]TYP86377.1 uncharacterized protein DUF721 [Nitrosomonas communis]UVS62691.1 DUF721 domain-containing protein [Nitrosomonas sp. PLL12]
MAASKVSYFLDILSKTPAHQNLFVSANQIIQIQRILQKTISPQLAKRCLIGKFSEGILVIYVDSSAIAAKLKHITPSLLKKFGSQVNTIQVIVNNQGYKNAISLSTNYKPQLSQKAAQNLSELVLVIPMSPLRTAVESLLHNCKPDELC